MKTKMVNKLVLLSCLLLFGCAKYGVSGCVNQSLGDWSEVRLPPQCQVKQVAAEQNAGVVILCEDGKVYH